jgi:hypothetical protein
MKFELTLKKSTKGTHVYSNDSEDSPVPSLYIKKSALPDKPPVKISISINYDH